MRSSSHNGEVEPGAEVLKLARDALVDPVVARHHGCRHAARSGTDREA
jgi:hypothetical protein